MPQPDPGAEHRGGQGDHRRPAGRGFFLINSHGGAEPCPFSPYSDVNVRELGVRGALQSPLFMALREGGVLDNDHVGGCVLYEQRDRVEKLLAGETA